MYKKINL